MLDERQQEIIKSDVSRFGELYTNLFSPNVSDEFAELISENIKPTLTNSSGSLRLYEYNEFMDFAQKNIDHPSVFQLDKDFITYIAHHPVVYIEFGM